MTVWYAGAYAPAYQTLFGTKTSRFVSVLTIMRIETQVDVFDQNKLS